MKRLIYLKDKTKFKFYCQFGEFSFEEDSENPYLEDWEQNFDDLIAYDVDDLDPDLENHYLGWIIIGYKNNKYYLVDNQFPRYRYLNAYFKDELTDNYDFWIDESLDDLLRQIVSVLVDNI